jgi:hypothetical protein
MSTISYSFEASFAGVGLDVVSFGAPRSRRLDTMTPERGDGAETFDRGQVVRIDRLTVAILGDADAVRDGLRTLSALVDTGDVRRFVHPIDGEWDARLEIFDPQIAPGSVQVSLTIVQFTELPTAERNKQNPDEEVTARDVIIDAQIADNQLELLGLDDISISSAVAAATEWTEDTPASERSEFIDQLRFNLTPTIDALKNSTQYQALLSVRRSIATAQRWSDTLSSGGWRFGEVRVADAVSLFSVLNSIYGSRTTRDIFSQVQALNSIRDPTQLITGTLLELPTRDSLGL